MIVNFYDRPMQEFGTQTFASSYIQNLIANTPLPICDTVRNGDLVIEGLSYIYNGNLIEVHKTGYIDTNNIGPLYPSDSLYPMNSLYPTDGAESAEYEILSQYRFGREYPKITYRFLPDNTFYDGDTHYHLGRYLRCLRSIYGVNYMPYYNCYTGQSLPNIQNYYDWQYIYVIPIKFNTVYTMSWQSNRAITLRPTLYHTKPITFENYNEYASQQSELNNAWNAISKQQIVHSRKYGDYYKFILRNENPIIQKHQKYLYLLFLADEPITSLSVVEGNYTNTDNIIIGNSDEADSMNDTDLEPPLPSFRDSTDIGVFEVTSKLKLLSSEGRDQFYAFSNRLVEGLLHHMINKQDEVYHNIMRVQKVMGMNADGIWDDKIQTYAFRDYMANATNLTHYDISGNIDKDVEYFYFGNNISAE